MSDQQKPYVNYNNYAQYYNTEAPPQPAWALQSPPPQPTPRTGWSDPRASPQYAQQWAQAGAPAASSYIPGQYGPMPSASAVGGQAPQHTWGVKYQHQQYQQPQQQLGPKPPLPPRPQSAASGLDTAVAPSQSQASSQWQGQANAHTLNEAWGTNSIHYHSDSQEPPPPPPRPPAYAQNASNWSQEHYASKYPSHHYEPSTNPNWSQASAGQQYFTSAGPEPSYDYNDPSGSQNPALVSCMDLSPSSWSQFANTALQATLSHTPAHDLYHPMQNQTQGNPNFPSHPTIQPTTALAGPTSDWEHFAPESQAVSPEISHNTTVDLKPYENISEPSSDHVADSLLPQKAPHALHDLHELPNKGRARPEQEDFLTDGPAQGPQRTGTIDSVINAWNAPLQPRKPSLRRPSGLSSPSTQTVLPSFVHGQSQAKLQDIRTQTSTPPNFAGPASDPYSDLEPQLRASLARFVSALRKESAKESDEERFKVFDSFVQKERRLRAVLYDIDLTPTKIDLNMLDTSQSSGNVPPTQSSGNVAPTQSSGNLPPTGETRTETMPMKSEGLNLPHKAPTTSVANVKQKLPRAIDTPPKPASPKLNESPKLKDKSSAMVEREQIDDVAAYSPGGRPLFPRPSTIDTHLTEVQTPTGEQTPAPSQGQPKHPPSDDAPQVIGVDYASAEPESPALAVPIVLATEEPKISPQLRLEATSNSPLPMPAKFEPSRPVYTPFRYAENPRRQLVHLDVLDTKSGQRQDYLSKRNTYDSSRLMAHDVTSNPSNVVVDSPTTTKNVQVENFLGLIRSHSTVRPKHKLAPVPESIRPQTTPPVAQMQSEPIANAVRLLRAVLPPKLPEKAQTDKVQQLRQGMETMVDDFGFIRELFTSWDRQNREIRKRLDEERHKRSEESETRLDDLFNDNEIAYAELKAMEADFKLAEAERRYDEDKQELESFTEAVYTPVTTRLQQQVDALNKEYVLAVDLLDLEGDSAAHMLTNSGIRPAMSDVMNIVLHLFEKLNVRYQKLAEARFESERRRKQLELSVLSTNGDSGGKKKLEREFSTAEKLQVLHEARDKDQKASRLTDSLERATVRALGDNQAFLDELFKEVQRLNTVLPAHGSWQQSATDSVYGEHGARGALALAMAIVNFILADSRALLTASNTADKILNDADYAVSVAEAKALDADGNIRSKLKADYTKEKRKLIEEMSLRMNSINKTPSDCAHLIQEIVARIGDDVDHPARMQKALEQAKMRNARTES